MSKKYLILMAKILLDAKPKSKKQQIVWKTTVKQIAAVMSSSNKLFSFSKFYAACGLEE